MRRIQLFLCALTGFFCLADLPKATAQEISPAAKDELVQMADRWGVPQPHPNSRLLKIWAFSSGDADRYALGFVEPENPDQALVGFDYWDISNGVETIEISEPGELGVADLAVASPFTGVFGVNSGLITGIQLLRQGKVDLGGKLIGKARNASAGHPRSPLYSPGGEEPDLMLARSCLAATLNQITTPKPDFPQIKQRVERLVKDRPELKTEAVDWVLDSLHATVTHDVSPKGSIERAIDDYLLSGRTEGALAMGSEDLNPAERALILKGFEAVPALLEQRKSQRLSNHLMQGFNNFPSFPMNAAQAVDSYLQRFANRRFDTDWLSRQQGGTASDEAVLAWWAQASELGEEAYVMQNTVVIDEEKHGSLSRELLLLAEVRYPEMLPEFCQTLFRTTTSSLPVLEAIVRSDSFSKSQKQELLEQAIATNAPRHRNAALEILQEMDPVVADSHLLRLLNEAPPSANGPYWIDQDASLGRYVSNSRSPEVWQALHALMERADLGMQMELIQHTFPPHDAPEFALRSFERIFYRFCNDATVRDESSSEKFSGPGAGFPYKRISMQDFVHTHWARWLELDVKLPRKDATEAEWKRYRDNVFIAVEQYE